MDFVKEIRKNIVAWEEYFSKSLFIEFKTNCGHGTNNQAGLFSQRTLWMLVVEEKVGELDVFGDSSLVVNWMKGTH